MKQKKTIIFCNVDPRIVLMNQYFSINNPGNLFYFQVSCLDINRILLRNIIIILI